MANEKKQLVYSYEEINQDMRGNKAELQNLLDRWTESEPSEYRTRIIKELNEELNSN